MYFGELSIDCEGDLDLAPPFRGVDQRDRLAEDVVPTNDPFKCEHSSPELLATLATYDARNLRNRELTDSWRVRGIGADLHSAIVPKLGSTHYARAG